MCKRHLYDRAQKSIAQWYFFLKIDNQLILHTRITELISLIQFAFFFHAIHRYEISHFSFVTSISLLRELIQIRISIKFTQIWIGYQRVKALILNPHFSRKRNKRMRKKTSNKTWQKTCWPTSGTNVTIGMGFF